MTPHITDLTPHPAHNAKHHWSATPIRWRALSVVVLLTMFVVLLGRPPLPGVGAAPTPRLAGARALLLEGIHKIQHVVVIMQENRSFDQYFGTYPGADGIPMVNGTPTACLPDPHSGTCVRPFHSTQRIPLDLPHDAPNTIADINNGKMDGFIRTAEAACGLSASCVAAAPAAVMGYKDGSDVPNYWSYAHNFVLQDHMFAPSIAYSAVEHLYMLSGWSAVCPQYGASRSCSNSQNPDILVDWVPGGPQNVPHFAWTDMTYLLHQHGVSWGFYVGNGTVPECINHSHPPICLPPPLQPQNGSSELWNPLPFFQTVQHDGEVGNIQPIAHFEQAAQLGTLPAVSWIVPDQMHSDHPPGGVINGQGLVTSLVNAVMRGPNWDSTAIFVTWDEWGGLYDHVLPPTVDANGFGLRVPALLISPYAKPGYIDHQVLSFDAFNKFIEDDFLGGQRLDPATDGRPDCRISVRDNLPQLGNLVNEFDFNQQPLSPVVLSPYPPTATPSGTPVASPTPLPTQSPLSSPTAPSNANIRSNPACGHSGDPVTVKGFNFSAHAPVTLYWNSTSTPPLTATTTNGNGAFDTTFRVPPATDGAHQIIAQQSSSGLSITNLFGVQPQLTLAPTSGPAGTRVAATGFSFGATQTVTLTWGTPPTLLLGTATSDALGSVALTITVPISAPGTYAVTAKGAQGTQGASPPRAVSHFTLH